MVEPLIAEKNQQVVDARHKFARKRYAWQYRWEPSPQIKAAIRKAPVTVGKELILPRTMSWI